MWVEVECSIRTVLAHPVDVEVDVLLGVAVDGERGIRVARIGVDGVDTTVRACQPADARRAKVVVNMVVVEALECAAVEDVVEPVVVVDGVHGVSEGAADATKEDAAEHAAAVKGGLLGGRDLRA